MDLPPIHLTLNDDGDYVVMVETPDEVEYSDPAALLSALPALADPAHAVQAAQAVNHLHEGFQYSVIVEPAAFAESYVARYNAAPGGEWDQEAQSLSDFDMPDLSVLALPQIDAGTLTYYAENRFIGLAYKVTMPLAGPDGPDYRPLP